MSNKGKNKHNKLIPKSERHLLEVKPIEPLVTNVVPTCLFVFSASYPDEVIQNLDSSTSLLFQVTKRAFIFIVIDIAKMRRGKIMSTRFCSRRKLVVATRFFKSRPFLAVSPSKINFCTDSAVPAHKNVLSLASSRMLKNSSEDIGSLEGLAWMISCE